jgi:ferritin-like metal-binding protein YciE
MSMETGQDLFEHELRDIFDAENKLVNALEKMAGKATDDQLKQAFTEHRGVTQKQIERLERVFGLIDRAPRREPCPGINGLIQEYQEFHKDEDPSPEVSDVFAAASAVKVESYEISAYESLIKLANQLGLTEAVGLFEESLTEEKETRTEASQMGEILGKKLG